MVFNIAWSPEPNLPNEPEFYRRVLHYQPSALVVVNSTGHIVYANHAMAELGGWTFDEDIGTTITAHIHPDDLDDLIQAFMDLSDSPSARMLGGGSPWAEIYFRIIAKDGTTIPIELVGNGGVLDPAVQGLIYEVRPAHARNLLGRILDGLSQGASMHYLLSLVVELIAEPPLDLEATILQSGPADIFSVAATTAPRLAEVFDSLAIHTWPVSRQPTAVAVNSLPEEAVRELHELGQQHVWCVAVTSPLSPTSLRILASSSTHHVPDGGPVNRLLRARELAAAVLLGTETDAAVRFTAGQDQLTELPNRAGFHNRMAAEDPTRQRAALHLDLDGVNHINAHLGHGAGDAVLQVVADRLRTLCRSGEIIGRVGDDEFTIVLSLQVEDELIEERALLLASRVQASIREPILIASRPLQLSASIGVAVAPPGTESDQLLAWAETAMHESKRGGGAQTTLYQGPDDD